MTPLTRLTALAGAWFIAVLAIYGPGAALAASAVVVAASIPRNGGSA